MTCQTCNVEMAPKLVEFEDEYRGEPVTVSAAGLVCPKCKAEWFGLEDVAEYGRHVADAYRRTHRLLTSNDIREVRERLKMSQEAFARFLGVGVASVKRWEWGLAQDRSHDKLMRVLTDPDEAQEAARRARALMAPAHSDPFEEAAFVSMSLTRVFTYEPPRRAKDVAGTSRLRIPPAAEFLRGIKKQVRIETETLLPEIPLEEMR